MRARRAALIVAIALAAPASASAGQFSPTLDYAYQLAAHHWGAQPTQCTSVDKETVPAGSLGQLSGEAWQPGPGYLGPCYLRIVDNLMVPGRFELACAIMRHEYGHLLGYGHSTDPRSIMYPQVQFIPGECDRAMLTVMNHPARFR